MVTVKNYLERKREDGSSFYVLILEGEVKVAKNPETGRIYFTTLTASVPATFDEISCKDLVGQKFPGTIQRQECDPYDYENDKTGKVIEYSYRNVYVDDNLEVVKENVIDEIEVE